MARRKVEDTTAFKPYAAKRLSSMFVKECIVAKRIFCGAMVIYERPAMPELGPLGLGVVAGFWHDKNLAGGGYPDVVPDEGTSLQSAIARIKKSMLTHGADAMAVTLVGELSPFEEKELSIMADKLKTKAAPAAKGKDKPAPAKGKGNTEALAKARAAKAEAGPDTRKITILNKENPYRADSNRAKSFDALKGAKTVDDYKSAGGAVKYISRWVDEGRIKVA